MVALDLPAGVTIDGAIKPGFEKVLTKEAVAFLAELQRKFNARREELLALRVDRQKRLDAGEKPDFLAETKAVRDGDWRVAGEGTSIGACRILRLDASATTNRVRLRITQSPVSPAISEFGLYREPA